MAEFQMNPVVEHELRLILSNLGTRLKLVSYSTKFNTCRNITYFMTHLWKKKYTHTHTYTTTAMYCPVMSLYFARFKSNPQTTCPFISSFTFVDNFSFLFVSLDIFFSIVAFVLSIFFIVFNVISTSFHKKKYILYLFSLR